HLHSPSGVHSGCQDHCDSDGGQRYEILACGNRQRDLHIRPTRPRSFLPVLAQWRIPSDYEGLRNSRRMARGFVARAVLRGNHCRRKGKGPRKMKTAREPGELVAFGEEWSAAFGKTASTTSRRRRRRCVTS